MGDSFHLRESLNHVIGLEKNKSAGILLSVLGVSLPLHKKQTGSKAFKRKAK